MRTELHQLILAKHGSVRRFATAAGIGRATVYRVLAGDLGTAATAERIARALDLSLLEVEDLVAASRAARAESDPLMTLTGPERIGTARRQRPRKSPQLLRFVTECNRP